MSVINLCVCQRWVSEKLSVESLRDLELFGGEVQGKPTYQKQKKHKPLFTHWGVYQHTQKTAFSAGSCSVASQTSSLNYNSGSFPFSQSVACYLFWVLLPHCFWSLIFTIVYQRHKQNHVLMNVLFGLVTYNKSAIFFKLLVLFMLVWCVNPVCKILLSCFCLLDIFICHFI